MAVSEVKCQTDSVQKDKRYFCLSVSSHSPHPVPSCYVGGLLLCVPDICVLATVALGQASCLSVLSGRGEIFWPGLLRIFCSFGRPRVCNGRRATALLKGRYDHIARLHWCQNIWVLGTAF